VAGVDPPPITAASLRARPERQRGFPGASVAYEEEADEGVGIGFDGLDPSAMARAFLRTPAPWPDVLRWYIELLAGLDWESRVVRDDWWWEWNLPSSPGEQFMLMDRGRTQIPGLVVPVTGTTMYEVLFTARGAHSAARSADA
jgi:hypothetical protein